MIEEIRQLYCDACKRRIPCGNYSSRRDVIFIDEDGYAQSIGMDFCEDCAKSFNEWIKQRESMFKKEVQP